MTRVRRLLLIDVVAFGFFGVAFVFWPAVVTHFVTGASIATPSAITDIRAIYGGMALGLAAFFYLTFAGSAEAQRIGIVASALSFGCIAIARAIGILVDGSGTGMMYVLLGSETLVATLSVALYLRLR